MEYVIGILLLCTFFGLAYYCIKGHNMMIGFLIMAVIWTVLPLGGTLFTGSDFVANNPVLQFGGDTDNPLIVILNAIYQSAPEGRGNILVNVCWGAWFGRVLLDTGIASTLIRRTVELGGDRPMLTTALLNIVTALIFTSMSGAGPVIAIGIIVLPILMSLGLPKHIALFTFMGSVAAGDYLNPVYFQQYRAYFLTPEQMPEFTLGWYTRQWGLLALVIMLVVTTVMTAIYLKRNKVSHAWAAQAPAPAEEAPEQKNAPWYTLILPIVPVLLNILLNFSLIGGFIIAGMLALLLCGKLHQKFRANCALISKQFFDGVVDSAPLFGFMLTLAMFQSVAKYASPYFEVILGGVMPTSELVVCIAFAIFLCMGLFRGPLSLAGCGAATVGVLSNMASFSVPFLYAVFAIPTITVNIGSCISQSWVGWGISYAKVESKDFFKLSIPNAYAAGIPLYIAAYICMSGLGAQWYL